MIYRDETGADLEFLAAYGDLNAAAALIALRKAEENDEEEMQCK